MVIGSEGISGTGILLQLGQGKSKNINSRGRGRYVDPPLYLELMRAGESFLVKYG